ncbi:MAG: hypothetical protein IJ633_02670 [Prevotella sp.]|nr:hypothetical protein [Prevotella sp.]
MKKLFTLCMFLLTAASIMAQDSNIFQFTDKDGNVIENGATITVKTPTTDDFGETILPSGIYVKNVSAGTASVRIVYQIQSIDNGDFQLCFPVNCIRKSETGTFTTESGQMTPNEIRDLQCEWYPANYGTCKATMTIEEVNALGTKVGDGPSVNLVFQYTDPADVNTIPVETSIEKRFNLQGLPVDANKKGFGINRLSDGRIVKTLNK